MKKIFWVSKNRPLQSQIEGLKKLFGEIDLTIDANPFSTAYDIIGRFKKGRYDEMVLIAPLSVCRIITDLGYKPLWSIMIRTSGRDSEVEVCGSGDQVTHNRRYYKFVEFKRLESIEVKFSEITPVNLPS